MKACGSISVSFDLRCNSETVEVDLSSPKYTSFEVAFISDFLPTIMFCASISAINSAILKIKKDFFRYYHSFSSHSENYSRIVGFIKPL